MSGWNPILSTIQQSNGLCKHLPIIRHMKIVSSCNIYDHPLYYSQPRDQRTTRRGPHEPAPLFSSFLFFLCIHFCSVSLRYRAASTTEFEHVTQYTVVFVRFSVKISLQTRSNNGTK